MSWLPPVDCASVCARASLNRRHKRMSATTVALDVACGGVSTAVVSAILNPTDVIKTRRQIGSGFSGASPLDMARAVARADGLRGLWLPGLQARSCASCCTAAARRESTPTRATRLPAKRTPSASRSAARGVTASGGSCAKARRRGSRDPDPGSAALQPPSIAAMRRARSEGVVRGLLARRVGVGAARRRHRRATVDPVRLPESRLAAAPAFARAIRGAEPFSLHIVTSVIAPVQQSTCSKWWRARFDVP